MHLEVFNSQHLILNRGLDLVDYLVNRASKLLLYHYQMPRLYLVRHNSLYNRLCHFNNNNNFQVLKDKIHYLVVHNSSNSKINCLVVYRRVLRFNLFGVNSNNNSSLRFKDLVLSLVAVVALWVNRVVQMILWMTLIWIKHVLELRIPYLALCGINLIWDFWQQLHGRVRCVFMSWFKMYKIHSEVIYRREEFIK